MKNFKHVFAALSFVLIAISFEVKAAPNCKDLSLNDKKSAKPGFTCVSSAGVTFQVVQEIGPKKDKVWLDVDKNMMFLVYYKGMNTLSVAKQACAQLPANDGVSWSLAMGYQPNENAKHGNVDSDIITLDGDAFTEVMNLPEEDLWFWLKDPRSPYYAIITLNSKIGRRVLYDYGSDDDTTGAICVKMVNP